MWGFLPQKVLLFIIEKQNRMCYNKRQLRGIAMRVGIDIDGTITDIFDFEVREGRKFFNKEPVNNHTLSVKEMFGCTEEEEQKML